MFPIQTKEVPFHTTSSCIKHFQNNSPLSKASKSCRYANIVAMVVAMYLDILLIQMNNASTYLSTK